MNTEQYIDHETRIRVQEQLSKDIKDILNHLDNKMDSQFKWIIGTILTLFGGIVLHLAKLI